MAVTAAVVKKLRQRTGAGMMDCKRALVRAEGDLEQASELLRKAGQAKADKRAFRIAAEGRVVVRSDSASHRHVIAEINSETDFVARDDTFGKFAESVTKMLLDAAPADVDALMALKVGGQTLQAARQALVTRMGENISVRRFKILETQRKVGSYVHMDRIGVLVETDGGDEMLVRDLAMQVAATSPRYVDINGVPQNILTKEREILAAEAAQEGKPAHIVEKIVEGRLRKHLDEITLMGQPFVKDPDKRVGTLLSEAGVTVYRFLRYELGEGIEKKQDNFVQEVMAQASKNL